MKRRDFLINAALAPMLPKLHGAADSPKHLWQGYDFGSSFPVRDRLNQGPFDIDEDQGWQTVLFTTPSEKPQRNPGVGLPGEAVPGALRGGKRQVEKPLSLQPRASAIALRKPQLGQTCRERHAPIPVERHRLALHLALYCREVFECARIITQSH